MYFFRDKKKYILNTKLNINECSRRLKALIDEERFSLFSLFGYAGSKEIIGKINGDRFRLQKRNGFRNSVDQFFYGKFNRRLDGTEIKGYFSMSPPVKAFMVFSVLGTITLFTFFFVNANEKIFNKGSYTGFINLSIFILCGLLFYMMSLKFGRWSARHRKEYIIQFLRENMDIKD